MRNLILKVMKRVPASDISPDPAMVAFYRGMNQAELFRRLCKYWDEDQAYEIIDLANVQGEYDSEALINSSLVIHCYRPHISADGRIVQEYYNILGDKTMYPELFKPIPISRKIMEPTEALYAIRFRDGSCLNADQVHYLTELSAKRVRHDDEELMHKLVTELLYVKGLRKEEGE